ncbi:MAG TPA: hypothetical protein VIM70_06400 [Clostridium sp.]|uniref:hypothetical protein n=1 Tax=Clostridium sp. TaxID=1506 RepID=UPI002F94A902
MGLFDSFKKIFNKNEDVASSESIEKITSNNIVYEIDEEDRIVVALAAAAMASENRSNSEFHISKITRIK